MQIVKKLTIKTCGNFTQKRINEVLDEKVGKAADGKQNPVPDGTSVDLLKIAGECSGAKSGSTDKGDYTKLTGSFIGTDMTTGEIYQAASCILPDYIGSQIGAAVLGNEGRSVEFAFMIGARAKGNSVTGYEFSVTSLMDIAPTAAQQRLLGLIGAAPKLEALPAAAASAPAAAAPAEPVAAPAPAPAPAPAAAPAKTAKK
jgi:hypothetical protein